MPCFAHDWYFDSPCPKCVAVAVTPPSEPEPAPDAGGAVPEAALEMEDIPPFLRRNPDNTFAEPWTPPTVSMGTTSSVQLTKTEAGAIGFMEVSDAQLLEWASSDMTVANRQPVLRELHRRENIKKARQRIAAMKERLDAKKGSE